MQRIPDQEKRRFHQALPKGWQVESIFYLPIPGWDCDQYVCRISDGINTRYMDTNHGRVKETTKKILQERLKAYQELLKTGDAWLNQ